jgi:hypothetical protein
MASSGRNKDKQCFHYYMTDTWVLRATQTRPNRVDRSPIKITSIFERFVKDLDKCMFRHRPISDPVRFDAFTKYGAFKSIFVPSQFHFIVASPREPELVHPLVREALLL